VFYLPAQKTCRVFAAAPFVIDHFSGTWSSCWHILRALSVTPVSKLPAGANEWLERHDD
jgi:hypothetical protein